MTLFALYVVTFIYSVEITENWV